MQLKALVLSLATAGILATAGSVCAGEADAALANFFSQYLEQSFAMRPMEATQLGDHRFDDRLDDLSAAARRRWVDHARETLDALPRRVDVAKLSPAAKVDYAIFRQELIKLRWSAENTHPYEEDPRVYNGYINDSIYLPLTQSTRPKEERVSACIARMKQIDKIVAAAKENLRRPLRTHTETAIRQNRGAIAFYQSELFDIVGQTPQMPAVKEAAAKVVEWLKDYQTHLERDVLPRSGDHWRLGKEKFARKLAMELDGGMSAAEVLREADAEFARVTREMYVVARQLWGRYYPDKPLPPDDEEGRRRATALVLHAVCRDHSRPEDLAPDAKATVAKIRKFIADRKILRLPEPDRCRVIEMPEFQRGNSTAFMNSAPPLDAAAASIYAVSPPPKDWDAKRVASFLEEYNRSMLQILTIHEAYPGHYVQLEYANRNPSLIRRVLGSGVYIEGWAVYTEQTMLDQGYGDGDLPLRLIQLKFYLRAVTNAILDHRMHCTDITDDQAMDLMVRKAFQSEGEARLKVIRSKQSSGQLSTYFVGRMAMYRLRQSIQRELGDQFDLARFHEAVLEEGSVPVKFLPELVRKRLGK
jgi:uncharacterized protein (DUF885 family)